MDFMERLFGLSPDAGNGSFELICFAILTLAASSIGVAWPRPSETSRRFAAPAASAPRMRGIQVDVVQLHVPVCDVQLEATLPIARELREVGIQLCHTLLFGRRGRPVRRFHELHGERAVRAPVALVLRNEGAD